MQSSREGFGEASSTKVGPPQGTHRRDVGAAVESPFLRGNEEFEPVITVAVHGNWEILSVSSIITESGSERKFAR